MTARGWGSGHREMEQKGKRLKVMDSRVVIVGPGKEGSISGRNGVGKTTIIFKAELHK